MGVAAVRTALDPAASNIDTLRRAVECIELPCVLDFEASLTEERARCEARMRGPEFRALRQAFLAERRAPKTTRPGLAAQAPAMG
ncbi:hypothetical protein GCM10025795_02800 [Verticiella sediminum]